MFITADHHFGHYNIIRHCNRPFKTAEEMDDCLIANWNSAVSKNDIVWHLGDIIFRSARDPEYYISALNGKISIIFGNHDHKVARRYESWFWEKYDLHEFNYNKKRIILCHYPLARWNGKNHGSIHFHGHSHGKYFAPGQLILDVGVDCHNYKPIPLDTAISLAMQNGLNI
jgi:calcineurin-like phosphoesterase family protein